MSVLVLCTGNSCRSQMAEGFLRSFGISVQSAGVESHGVNNYAIKVMDEIGIDITNQYSKTVNEIDLKKINIIITVCNNAKQGCPYIPGLRSFFHKSFKDPSSSLVEIHNELLVYRKVRDDIKQYILSLIKEINNINE